MTTLTHPQHVPADVVRDFDFYNLPGLVNGSSADIHNLWKNVQDTMPDIFWTPRNGGHWVLTRYKDMFDMVLKPGIFSNRENQIPLGGAPFFVPVNLDPPEHGIFRKLMMPFFSPASLEKATTKARSTAVDIIEQLRQQGSCEFFEAFAGVMPVVAFMTLVNLPLSDMPYLRGLSANISPVNPESPAAWAEFGEYVRKLIEDRRVRPRDGDLFSSLHMAEVHGRKLTDKEIFDIALLFTVGGLDTVASQLCFSAAFLARSPAHRRELIDHPDRTDRAIEELFRRFGVSNLARVVAQDVEFGGRQMLEGDAVLLPFPLAGLDETVNPDPMTVDFQRKGARHLLFSSGPHLCIGNRLAKREMRIFMEEWLPRIPDFSYAPGHVPAMATGIINHVNELRLVWDV
ncbi:cytochrome P450 [Sphingorhabdus sp.]|jgi:cytochrome P450|uniref:cytochrome P450 n=1 Tax=Sphingorhabdus sp. TaxID=1902408 RepID=UPI0037C9DCDA